LLLDGQANRVAVLDAGPATTSTACWARSPRPTCCWRCPTAAVYNAENFRNILLSTYRHKQGVIGFSSDMVKAGALATTYSEIEDINAQVAEMAAGFRRRRRAAGAAVPALLPHHRQRGRGALARRRRQRSECAQLRPPRAGDGHERLSSGAAGASACAWPSLPCCRWRFLFTSFVWYSWYAHRAQVAEELAERGRILARALAETSEYNVISGNLADLRLTINGLVQSDKSIYRIDVVDASGRMRVSVMSRAPDRGRAAPYEAPIRKQVLWINLFSDNGTPHVSASSDTRRRR
jgi:hypothetical protein